MSAEVPDIVGDSTAVIGLITASITLVMLVVGLLWKAFRTHSLLESVVAEMRPNHGSSLRDQVDASRAMVEDNGAQLARLAEVHRQSDISNAQAHADIHRRIDGVFELLGGPGANGPRRVAEQHRAKRDGEEG